MIVKLNGLVTDPIVLCYYCQLSVEGRDKDCLTILNIMEVEMKISDTKICTENRPKN